MIISVFILIVAILSFLGMFFYTRNIRRKMIFMFLEKNILKTIDYCDWYSSSVIFKTAKNLNKLKRHQLLPVFTAIKSKNFNPLMQIMNDDELKIICGKKITLKQELFLTEKACLNFKFDKAQQKINLIKPKNKQEKARIIFLEAQIALYEGDMERASIKTARAIKLFKNIGFFYEEALAYLLCGTIYRVTAIFDTAQFMLQTAANLFADIGAKNLEAVVWANIGMLLTAENRFDEADDAFAKALNLFEKNKNVNGQAEVLNQQALTALINNDVSKAQKLINTAEKLLPLSNIKSRALNSDIAAQIAAKQEKNKKTIMLAKIAADLYKKTNNFSAMLEAMYLQATALIKQNKLKKADELLRNIIKQAKTTPSCFHIANAYALLGTVYMKQEDFKRALSLFNQSLSRELCNERWAGAAIDYANIALAEIKRKKDNEANKHILTALKYAEESGNELLVAQLQKMFNLEQNQT